MADGGELEPIGALVSDQLREAIERAAEVATATDEQIAAMEARLAMESWRDRLAVSGIAAVLRQDDRTAIVHDKLSQTDALRAVRGWLAKATAHPPDRNVLVLCGPPGLGKTVAAGWAITRCGGLYASVTTYLRDYDRWLRDKHYQDSSTNTLARYKRAHLVVLDELGRERDAEVMRDAFFKLIDERQSRRRELTILITNLSRADFIARLKSGVYDERSYSRLARDARVIGIEGADMRRGAL